MTFTAIQEILVYVSHLINPSFGFYLQLNWIVIELCSFVSTNSLLYIQEM